MPKQLTESHDYDDIINLPHPTSASHPRMSIHDRAAQFSPFAALTGYEPAIQETARLTEEKIELDDDAITALNENLLLLSEALPSQPEVTVTYFVADEKKSGGSYTSVRGVVRKIDSLHKTLTMQNGLVIPMEDMTSLSF